MLKAPGYPPLPILSVPSPSEAFDSSAEVPPYTASDGALFIPVTVGPLGGYYSIETHKVIDRYGVAHTPTAFECAGGKENNRKWRLSLRLLLPDGSRGKTLGQWLVAHHYDHMVPSPNHRLNAASPPPRRSYNTGGAGSRGRRSKSSSPEKRRASRRSPPPSDTTTTTTSDAEPSNSSDDGTYESPTKVARRSRNLSSPSPGRGTPGRKGAAKGGGGKMSPSNLLGAFGIVDPRAFAAVTASQADRVTQYIRKQQEEQERAKREQIEEDEGFPTPTKVTTPITVAQQQLQHSGGTTVYMLSHNTSGMSPAAQAAYIHHQQQQQQQAPTIAAVGKKHVSSNSQFSFPSPLTPGLAAALGGASTTPYPSPATITDHMHNYRIQQQQQHGHLYPGGGNNIGGSMDFANIFDDETEDLLTSMLEIIGAEDAHAAERTAKAKQEAMPWLPAPGSPSAVSQEMLAAMTINSPVKQPSPRISPPGRGPLNHQPQQQQQQQGSFGGRYKAPSSEEGSPPVLLHVPNPLKALEETAAGGEDGGSPPPPSKNRSATTTAATEKQTNSNNSSDADNKDANRMEAVHSPPTSSPPADTIPAVVGAGGKVKPGVVGGVYNLNAHCGGGGGPKVSSPFFALNDNVASKDMTTAGGGGKEGSEGVVGVGLPAPLPLLTDGYGSGSILARLLNEAGEESVELSAKEQV